MKNLVLLLIVTLISCSSKKEPIEISPTFDLYGTSTFFLLNKSTNSVQIEMANYPVIIGGVEEFNTILNIEDTVKYQLKTPGYSYFTCTINGVYYKVFIAPKSEVRVEILSDSLVNFVGDFASINNYLAKSSGSFYSTHLAYVELANLQGNPSLTYAQLMSKNDELVTKHRKILSENEAELPHWYLELENKRLLVLGAHLKLNSLSYRKRMLKFDDEIPPHYVESIMNNIPYQDKRLMGFSIFSRFMFDYSVQSFNPLNDTSANSLKERYKDSLFAHTIKLLPTPYNDYAVMSHLSMVLQYDRTKVRTEWIELVTDTTFKNYLNSEIKIKAKLPKGALSPQFSGLTVDSNMINSNQFKDSVLLINFWASFCSPCIANFPHENELAVQYQNQPVKIINMCIETDFEMFKVFVEMHDLKTFNLFADKKRTASLKKDFDIHGIPHSVLIDKNGLVVKNKCSVRGDGIVADIEALLK